MNAYQLLDSGNGEKLEHVGPHLVRRPAPAAIWQPRLPTDIWQAAEAHFYRHTATPSGEAAISGAWQVANPTLKNPWLVRFDELTLQVRLSEMGQLGFFAEQLPNWQQLTQAVRLLQARARSSAEPIKVLNLFAYTGGSTLACASAGAHVVHVDAAKASVSWARANAELSGLSRAPIRWIVDDARNFVAREIRRGATYHGIILDPPSFGRGASRQTWQIDLHLPRLLTQIVRLVDPQCGFILLSAHSPGYTARALSNRLAAVCLGRGAERHVGDHPVEGRNDAAGHDAGDGQAAQSHYDLVVNEAQVIATLPGVDPPRIARSMPSGACAWRYW